MSREREVIPAKAFDAAGELVAEWRIRQVVPDPADELARIPRRDRAIDVVDGANHLLAVGSRTADGRIAIYRSFGDAPAPTWILEPDGLHGLIGDAHALGYHVVPEPEDSVPLACHRCRAVVALSAEALRRGSRRVVLA